MSTLTLHDCDVTSLGGNQQTTLWEFAKYFGNLQNILEICDVSPMFPSLGGNQQTTLWEFRKHGKSQNILGICKNILGICKNVLAPPRKSASVSAVTAVTVTRL